MSNAYPILILACGFVMAAILSKRALALLQPKAKSLLMDSFARTRPLNLVVLATFLILIFWRPSVGWAFLGCVGAIVPVWFIPRLRRLNLPGEATRRLVAAHLLATIGIVACAAIFVRRALE